MRELFIYYRVRSAQARAAKTVVQDLHAALRAQRPGLTARLLCRAEGAADAPQTWMETYAIDGGVDAALQARIEALAQPLLPLIDGARHTESFTACAS